MQQLKTPGLFRSTKQNKHFYKFKNANFQVWHDIQETFAFMYLHTVGFWPLEQNSPLSYGQRSAYSSIDSPLNHRVKTAYPIRPLWLTAAVWAFEGSEKCRQGRFIESSTIREHCMTESVHVWRFPWSGPLWSKARFSMKGGHGLKSIYIRSSTP